MTLEQRITEVVQAIGTDIKNVGISLAGKADDAHTHDLSAVFKLNTISIGAELTPKLGYIVSTAGSYSLPASPTVGDAIPIMINLIPSVESSIIFLRNGNTIESYAENLEITDSVVNSFWFVWNGTTWRVKFINATGGITMTTVEGSTGGIANIFEDTTALAQCHAINLSF